MKSNRLAGGPHRANRAQARVRKISSLEYVQELATDRASRANDRNVIFFHRQTDCTAALISCKADRKRRRHGIGMLLMRQRRWEARATRSTSPFAINGSS